MANPAIGQASRDRMARNHRALSDRFTSESWRSSKHAGASQKRSCAGTTKAGDPCQSPVQYGALAGSTERPEYRGPDADTFFCHRHATQLLESEKNSG